MNKVNNKLYTGKIESGIIKTGKLDDNIVKNRKKTKTESNKTNNNTIKLINTSIGFLTKQEYSVFVQLQKQGSFTITGLIARGLSRSSVKFLIKNNILIPLEHPNGFYKVYDGFCKRE